MPELPEVETVVRTLQPLVGRRLGTPHVLRADVIRGGGLNIKTFARGKTIQAIRREAKRIIFDLGGDRQIQFHLGMTGQLILKNATEPLLPHTHLLLPLAAGGEELRFRDVRRFGGVWLVDGACLAESAAGFSPRGARRSGRHPDERSPRRLKPAAPRGFGLVGLDALAISLPQFRRLMSRRRQLKALLLDQTAIGGLGNIYVDESLFKACIHPLTRASHLSPEQVHVLYQAMRSTLRAAIRAGGSTIRDYRSPNGEEGWFQYQHLAYGREAKPCRRCKTPIQRIQAAGRSSHICPACQRKPRLSG